MKKIVFLICCVCLCGCSTQLDVSAATKAFGIMKAKIAEALPGDEEIQQAVQSCIPQFERNKFTKLGENQPFETLSAYCPISWKKTSWSEGFTDYLIVSVSNSDVLKNMAENKAYLNNKNVYFVALSIPYQSNGREFAMTVLAMNYDISNNLYELIRLHDWGMYDEFVGNKLRKK